MPASALQKSSQVKFDNKLGRDLLLICFGTTIVFTPSLTVDAFNPPKFLLMSLGVFYLFVRYRKYVVYSLINQQVGLFLLFGLLLATLVLIFNHYSFSERFFGIERRNFGYVTVVCFFAIAFMANLARRTGSLHSKSIFSALMITNLVVSAIFIFQFNSWGFTEFNSEYNVLPSSLGNPNFLSSFIAISLAGTIGWILHPDSKRILKPLATLQVLISIWIIDKTQSIQGFVAMAIGAIFFVIVLMRKFAPKPIIRLMNILVLGVTLMCLVAFFGLGWNIADKLPPTLEIRSVYWRIGMQMVQESPLVGFGFDSYLDNFRRYLQPKYVDTIGPGVISDSPHNLFLDFYVSGGIFFGFFVMTSVAIAMFKGLRRCSNSGYTTVLNHPEENLILISVILLAVAFISPFQLGLFIWLPLIFGSILSDNRQKIASNLNQEPPPKILSSIKKNTAGAWLIILVICNPAIALLPFVTEVRYRSAVETRDFYDLRTIALAWPTSGGRATAIAQGMLNASIVQGDLPDLSTQQQLLFIRRSAIDLAQSSVKVNPKNYESWRFLFQNAPDEVAKQRARESLRRIDPFNQEWSSTEIRR